MDKLLFWVIDFWPLTYDIISHGDTTSQAKVYTHQVWSQSDLRFRREESRQTFLGWIFYIPTYNAQKDEIKLKWKYSLACIVSS